MSKMTTLEEFRIWRRRYKHTRASYRDVWQTSQSHALDQLFIDLADIYSRSTSDERRRIEQSFSEKRHGFLNKGPSRLFQLVLFERRAGKLITSDRQSELVRAGLAIAAIESGKFDFRDTIVSLVLLRFAAERNGIDFEGPLDEIMSRCNSAAFEIFRNIKNHSAANVLYTVNQWGPPEWK